MGSINLLLRILNLLFNPPTPFLVFLMPKDLFKHFLGIDEPPVCTLLPHKDLMKWGADPLTNLTCFLETYSTSSPFQYQCHPRLSAVLCCFFLSAAFQYQTLAIYMPYFFIIIQGMRNFTGWFIFVKWSHPLSFPLQRSKWPSAVDLERLTFCSPISCLHWLSSTCICWCSASPVSPVLIVVVSSGSKPSRWGTFFPEFPKS